MTHARFAMTLVASLVLMFVLSLVQIRSLDHFYLNASNFYIALTMVAAMGLLMLGAMWSMFKDRRGSAVTAIVLTSVLAVALVAARTEPFVGDKRFLESMIPHHSRAVLVCQESDLVDPEVIALCGQIVETQLEEIRQMEEILERY